MYHSRLRGDYYEMGYRYGSLLHKNGFRFPEVSPEKLAFGEESSTILKAYYPGAIAEIQGFADGCAASFEQVSSFLLTVGLFGQSPQCSIFAVWNGSDMIVGRNYDMLLDVKKYTDSSLVSPNGRFRYIGHSDVFIGKVDGMNEHGLAVAITLVPSPLRQPSVHFYFATRYVLEHCRTVDEAVRVLSGFPASLCCNYLLADPTGGMAVVEASPERIRVRRPEAGGNSLICTNHHLHPEMTDITGSQPEAWSKTTERYAAIQQQLRLLPQPGVEDAIRILSDTKGHVCLNLKEHRFGTLYSIVMNLSQLELYRAEGAPNRCKYKRDDRLTALLKRTV
ncbi:C45 family peptidase [Paenibacillus sp. 32O-W]|uniref:C45 family autoproteolytic acyltransferase/hydolase n=1 Tax=Paenibacillus sp. 32O-W TaxID=1695218 RepID=UPI0011A13AD2|nr:C45 family peptidase [Paenibacillus sp. 32O-W]